MRVVVFDGQGSSTAAPSRTSTPNTPTSSPLGKLFLQECNTIFSSRISTVSNTDIIKLSLSIEVLHTVVFPIQDDRWMGHPLLSIPNLYVQQVLRILETVEDKPDLLSSSARDEHMHVLGYSSGLLPSLFLATTSSASQSQLSLLRRASSIFKIALSLGLHSQLARSDMFELEGVALDSPEREYGWSSVVLGRELPELDALVRVFNNEVHTSEKPGPLLRSIFITAQTTPSCHTVSGLPSSIRAFSNFLSGADSEQLSLSIDNTTASSTHTDIVSVKRLNVCALFHTDVPALRAVRDAVLEELFPFGSQDLTPICDFPIDNPDCEESFSTTETHRCLSSLQLNKAFSLYDTQSGSPLPIALTGQALVSRLLDLILIERVEFATLLKRAFAPARNGKLDEDPEILNLGPGLGLARVVARTLKIPVNAIVDLSVSHQRSAGQSSSNGPKEPIAIVGMAVNLPGAGDTAQLWKILEQGLNTLQEIPSSRFSVSSFGSTDNNIHSTKVQMGNFLPGNLHAGFDNAFFKISPRESLSMDPQMRVLMRVGLQAMEASGLVVQDSCASASLLTGEGEMRSEDIGCFVGVATNDYAQNLRNDIGVHYATGTLPAFLAGRLAYALQLSGPSTVVNTACSSSMVAIQQACRALQTGDCKAALAGGVNIITSPDMYVGLERAHFLSPTGQCKPWDASADGYSRAEGCGIFVLKRMSQALLDNDNILGTIKAVEVNQSAFAGSITRPHGPTQEKLFRQLLRDAGVKPEEVSLVEAHGTGTQAGDPEEMRSLRSVLSPVGGRRRSASRSLHVTSIKGNIGHPEAASGAASLAKVLLMFRHGVIPPQIGLRILNSKIDSLDVDNTKINTSSECAPWESDRPRIALINNFGAAGSNAALLIEEPPAAFAFGTTSKEIDDKVLISLSAETEDAALRLRDSYVAMLSRTDENSLADFAYSATARRRLRPWRIAISADSSAAAINQLKEARLTHVHPALSQRKTIFLYSGQGGQHLRMGQQLYSSSKIFKAVVDECEQNLLSWGYPGVLSVINSSSTSAKHVLHANDAIVAFQCAVFVLECALSYLWTSWGVKPDAVVGHSLGEYAALVAAEVIPLNTGLRLVAHRSRLMTEKCQTRSSGMLAVRVSAHIVSDIMANLSGCEDLSIACYNSSKDVVVGGPLAQLALLKSFLGRNDSRSMIVDVPFAYHTEAMRPVIEEIVAFASKFDFAPPRIPVVSGVTGRLVLPHDFNTFNAQYFGSHCLLPVRFEEGVRDLMRSFGKNSIGTWIEIGPHPTSLPFITPLLSSTNALMLSSLHRKATPRSTLSSSLARLFTSRSGIKWGRVFRELYPSVRVMEIPGYPLCEKNYWIPYQGAQAPLNSCETPALARYAFLETWVQKPASVDANVSIFETPIKHIADYISGHRVVSHPLCPASVYHELAQAAARCTLEATDKAFKDDLLTLTDVQFTHPLVYEKEVPLSIRTTVNLHPLGAKYTGTFTISSLLDGQEVNVHCTGFFSRKSKAAVTAKLDMHSGTVERGKDSLLHPSNGSLHETLRTRTIYELVFSRIVQYSKQYQVIRSMTVDEWQGNAFASAQLPPGCSTDSFVVQPVFVDSLLHAAGFVINSQVSSGDAYICSQVDSTKVLSDLDYTASYDVYCTTSSVADGVVLADAWAIQGGESRKVVAHVKRMRFTRLRASGFERLLSRSGDGSPKSAHSTPSGQVLGSPFRFTPRTRIPSSPLSSETAVNSSIDFGAEVIKSIAQACGIPSTDIDASSHFADLGVDSLIWVGLIGELKESVHGEIDTASLIQSETVGDLINRLMKKTAVPPLKSPPTPQLIIPRTHIESSPTLGVSSALDMASIRNRVKDVLADILGMSPLDLKAEDRMDDLGLDSIGCIEGMRGLQALFNVALPPDLFQTHPTINALAFFISNTVPSLFPSVAFPENEKSVDAVASKNMIQLQASGKSTRPLFLVHDGSGLSNCYSRIGTLDRPLWGISNPKLLTGGYWVGGLPEIANHYRDQVTPMLTNAGCILGGWSFGGVVAFHMACEMQKAGIKVAGVVLIDSPSPFTNKSLPEELIDTVIQASGASAMPVSSVAHQTRSDVARLARKQMRHSTRAIVEYNPVMHSSITEAKTFPPVVMLRCVKGYNVSELLGCEPVPLLEERKNPKDMVKDWEALTGATVPVLDIPGHHFEPFHPHNVNAVTEQLMKAISLIENTNSQRDT